MNNKAIRDREIQERQEWIEKIQEEIKEIQRQEWIEEQQEIEKFHREYREWMGEEEIEEIKKRQEWIEEQQELIQERQEWIEKIQEEIKEIQWEEKFEESGAYLELQKRFKREMDENSFSKRLSRIRTRMNGLPSDSVEYWELKEYELELEARQQNAIDRADAE